MQTDATSPAASTGARAAPAAALRIAPLEQPPAEQRVADAATRRPAPADEAQISPQARALAAQGNHRGGHSPRVAISEREVSPSPYLSRTPLLFRHLRLDALELIADMRTNAVYSPIACSPPSKTDKAL